MQELCIYAGTYTEYYSTYRKMILHSTSKNIIFIMIDLYLYLYLSLYKLKNNACLLQGIAGSGLVHIRSTCLSLLRFPRIFWYNYTHTHTYGVLGSKNTVEHVDSLSVPDFGLLEFLDLVINKGNLCLNPEQFLSQYPLIIFIRERLEWDPFGLGHSL